MSELKPEHFKTTVIFVKTFFLIPENQNKMAILLPFPPLDHITADPAKNPLLVKPGLNKQVDSDSRLLSQSLRPLFMFTKNKKKGDSLLFFSNQTKLNLFLIKNSVTCRRVASFKVCSIREEVLGSEPR